MRLLTYSYLIATFCLFCSSLHSENPSIHPQHKNDVTSFQLLNAGVANQVFLVQNVENEKFGFKIFKRKTAEQLKPTYELLKVIKSNGIKVPLTIIPPTQVGTQTIAISEFVEGSHITDSHLSKVAELMGKLHLIESPITTLSSVKDLSPLFDLCSEWEYCNALKEIYESLDLSYLDALPNGIIHGDFSYTNLLCDQNGELTLIDFDHLRYDHLLTDLVRCQMFYGFDSTGTLKTDILQTFVSHYDRIRPLKTIELDNFFTHMKLCMIETTLEMYIHMYLIGDLPVTRVLENPNNSCLNPDLLAQEVISIKDKRSYILKNQTKTLSPIFFFGLSGVGKTTLINLINDSSELFYIPKFTVTRKARSDDDARYFEYISVADFLRAKDQNEFMVWMNQEGVYYGYKFSNLTDKSRHPLMNASAYGIDAISKIDGIRVLVQGDANKGLELRADDKMTATRKKVNKVAIEKFFGNPAFVNQMHIIHTNEFGNPNHSAKELKKKIMQELDHAN